MTSQAEQSPILQDAFEPENLEKACHYKDCSQYWCSLDAISAGWIFSHTLPDKFTFDTLTVNKN